MDMVQVNELTKSYPDLARGEFLAVDGISFRAAAGEIFGVLGPNGAGKTTALRILSTILQPSSGTVVINGANVVTNPDWVRRSIGFVSNNTALYDRMSAREMVEYFGRIHEIEERLLKSRIEKLFSNLRMDDFGDTPCGKMSTGMKQKVSIARALVHDPPVVIFDEASVGLDVMVSRALLETISSLRDAGKCVIFSTHIMREAERLCDRIAIMHRGNILAEGTLGELRERHQQHDLEELFFQLISEHEALEEADQNPQLPVGTF